MYLHIVATRWAQLRIEYDTRDTRDTRDARDARDMYADLSYRAKRETAAFWKQQTTSFSFVSRVEDVAQSETLVRPRTTPTRTDHAYEYAN